MLLSVCQAEEPRAFGKSSRTMTWPEKMTKLKELQRFLFSSSIKEVPLKSGWWLSSGHSKIVCLCPITVCSES